MVTTTTSASAFFSLDVLSRVTLQALTTTTEPLRAPPLSPGSRGATAPSLPPVPPHSPPAPPTLPPPP
eukprot:4607807-Prymnesium_polylepis.1